MIYLYYTDQFMGYNFGPEHPLQPVRLRLTYKLIEEYGLLDSYETETIQPYFASEEDLLRVHTPDYLEAVKSEEPDLAFGLGIDDNPVFSGIYEASRLLAGGSTEAARLMTKEDCSAFNIGGGLHHALPTQASGFCIFNDPALAICILKEKFERILYVDIDGHHGDGVQAIFYDDPRVLTVSLHESGKYLFPGTGFIDELGTGEGRGYSANIPMPMHAVDEMYHHAFDEIVPTLFEWFRPQVVVSQLGADTHHSDPLTSLNITLNGYRGLVQRIKSLTDKYADGRMLALGGGGYNLELVPLAWAIAFEVMTGSTIPEVLPAWWIDFCKTMLGRSRVSLDDVAPHIEVQEMDSISRELEETITGLKSKLSDLHGIF
jgi:acetoin utilization protein AcuC